MRWWTGGVANNDDASDKYVDYKGHYLSGPIGVKGAEPGDLLVVDILDVGMLEDSLWALQVFLPRKTVVAS